MTSSLIRPAAFAFVAVLVVAVPAQETPLWLAVGHPDVTAGLADLAAHRRSGGFEVRILPPPVEDALRAAGRRPAHLLLVGDDAEGHDGEAWVLRAPRRPFYRWRAVQPREFPSDALSGDLDHDLVPDIPVGRIPARSKAEVALVARKILDFERRPPALEDLRLVAWAGAPNYGPQIDAAATGLMTSTITKSAPEWIAPWMMSSAAGTPLCGWPPDQPGRFAAELRRGGFLGAVMAHASADSVLAMRHENRPIRFGIDDAAALAEGPPAPPLVFFTCDSGMIHREAPCLAERLLLLPGGPVATIAATTESHPLTNYFSGKCLLESLRGGPRSLGETWLAAQTAALTAKSLVIQAMLKDAEGRLEDEIDVAQLRRDQALLYVLLGDPATRLKFPEPLRATITSDGDGWRYAVERPEGASSLVVGLRVRPARRERGKPPAPAGADEARAALEEANQALAFASQPSPPPDGPWEGRIASPGELRLVAIGKDRLWVAVLKLER